MTRRDTRARILEVALRLFAERGYAGTSVRDIAEELGITKAAVHYHFAAKERLLESLVAPFVERLEAVVEEPCDDPRAVLVRVGEALRDPVFGVLTSDPSTGAVCAHLHQRVDRLAERTAAQLAGPGAGPERQLRAYAALGAIIAASQVLTATRGPGATACLAATPGAREVVLGAALAALGEPAAG